jgi:hypothetical protein
LSFEDHEFRRDLLHGLAERLLLAGLFAVFILLYRRIYILWLVPVFWSMNFTYHPPRPGYESLAWALALLPTLWLPLSLRRPSQLIYWSIYVIVFIPSMFVPMYMALMNPRDIRTLMLVLTASFLVAGIGYLLPLPRIQLKPLSPRFFWTLLYAGVAIADIWIIAVFHSDMRLVSLGQFYDVRLRSRDVLSGSLVGYAMLPMAATINPLLVARGLLSRKLMPFLIGAAGEVLIMACQATKSAAFSTVAVILVYYLVRYGGRRFAISMAAGAVSLLGVLTAIASVASYAGSAMANLALAVIFERLFATPGMLSAEYYQFFSVNRLTYFSHVKGISAFVTYPYAQPLGFEIANYYNGNPILNANAHFWMTDGMAALGLPGIVLISFVLAGVLWVLDASLARHDLAFAAAALAYQASQICNGGLLSAVATGGLLVGFFVYALMPPLIRPGSEPASRTQPGASPHQPTGHSEKLANGS